MNNRMKKKKSSSYKLVQTRLKGTILIFLSFFSFLYLFFIFIFINLFFYLFICLTPYFILSWNENCIPNGGECFKIFGWHVISLFVLSKKKKKMQRINALKSVQRTKTFLKLQIFVKSFQLIAKLSKNCDFFL